MFLFGFRQWQDAIAERITRLMGDSISFRTPSKWTVRSSSSLTACCTQVVEHGGAPRPNIDRRWVEIRAPYGGGGRRVDDGELDLLYNSVGGFYEAPLQMKANGGIFLIDDFGRQLVRPIDLLNRWIVPLEKRTTS